MKLEGKVALITGGGTGIGKAAAQMVAEEGGISIVAGRRIGPLEETVAEITQAGGKAAACPADVSKVEDIERLKDFVQENYGRLDILVNNAGSSLFKSFLDTSVEDLDRIYQVDLRSVYLVSQYMVPLMRENGGGSIINISSILGVLGGKKVSAYCAMKGGVVMLTKALAAELGPVHGSVNERKWWRQHNQHFIHTGSPGRKKSKRLLCHERRSSDVDQGPGG
jgi:NAD(P)-dependent dehydrogenase (short-subunit alcohol dehydrogenase family)